MKITKVVPRTDFAYKGTTYTTGIADYAEAALARRWQAEGRVDCKESVEVNADTIFETSSKKPTKEAPKAGSGKDGK